MSTSTLEDVKQVLGEVLQLGDRTRGLAPETPLFGAIPEFDSMAVVSVLAGLEDRFGIAVEDDEISAEIFRTVGSLSDFVRGKLAA